MKRNTLKATLLSAATLCAIGAGLTTPAAANLIQNGSFETPAVADIVGLGNDAGVLLPHWNSTTSDNSAGFTQNYIVGSATPSYSDKTSNGNQMIMFNGDGLITASMLSQTFPTNVGTHYTLTFDLSRQTAASDPAQIPFSYQVTGSTLQTILTPGGAAANSYVPETYTFTATSGSTTLTFSTAGGIPGGSNNSPELDNVAVNVATPEPAALALFGIGACSLVLATRRQRQRNRAAH